MYRRIVAGIAAFLAFSFAEPVPADQADCSADGDESLRRQAEQKVVLLEHLLGDTEPVVRVLESGDPDAIAAIESAREAVARARSDLDSGCNASAAETVSEGLNLASRAFMLVRNTDARSERDYQALHQRTTSLLQMLESRPVETRGISVDDVAGMRRQLSSAETLAINGEFDEASIRLNSVADRLERRLVTMFDQQTVYYEREFRNSTDEYAYLAEQYDGYRLLLQQIATERQPPFSSRQNYESVLQEAADLKDEAERLAMADEWPSSLTVMQEALTKCEQALRLIGVMY